MRFTADAENPQGGVIEVQTGSFFAPKKRLPVYLMAGRVDGGVSLRFRLLQRGVRYSGAGGCALPFIDDVHG